MIRILNGSLPGSDERREAQSMLRRMSPWIGMPDTHRPAKSQSETERSQSLVDKIRRHSKERTERRKHFGALSSADTAWDMLLEVMLAALEGRRVSISSLCLSSGSPATTALRHLVVLVADGWIARVDDPVDRRRSFACPTTQAIRAFASWGESFVLFKDQTHG